MPYRSNTPISGGKGKPALCVFVGDTHSGSDTGLAPARYWMESKGRYYGLSRAQSWLLKCFGEFVLLVNEYRKDYEILAFFGGDMTDGVQHHDSLQTAGTRKEQVEMAVEATRPLWSIAEERFVCYGTAAHVGESGDDDSSFAAMIGARPQYRGWYHRLEINGRVLDWAHHGLSVSKRPALETGALYRAAVDEHQRCLESGDKRPSLILRHHAHRSPAPVTAHDITVCICPAWQLATDYGHTIAPGVPPSIGGVLWDTESGSVERIRYPVKRELVKWQK